MMLNFHFNKKQVTANEGLARHWLECFYNCRSQHLLMYDVSNLEVDGLQPQKATSSSTSISQNLKAGPVRAQADKIGQLKTGKMEASWGGLMVWGMFSLTRSYQSYILWLEDCSLLKYYFLPCASFLGHNVTKQKWETKVILWTWQCDQRSSVRM